MILMFRRNGATKAPFFAPFVGAYLTYRLTMTLSSSFGSLMEPHFAYEQATGTITGMGFYGYRLALEAVAHLLG